jgi:hypothetical protein
MPLLHILAAIYVPVIICTLLLIWRHWYNKRDKGAKVIPFDSKFDDTEKFYHE